MQRPDTFDVWEGSRHTSNRKERNTVKFTELTGRTLIMLALVHFGLHAGSGAALQTPAPDPGSHGEPGPALSSFAIPSHGDSLITRVLTPAGPGPHPLVILLHGFPGNENNFDLAHALRRRRWASAIFHYRGSWGSPGRFTFSNVLEDVDVAVDHLREPEVAGTLRVDPSRVYVVGHSMGGFAAIYTAAGRSDVAGAASLAGFNFGASAEAIRERPELRAPLVEAFAEALLPLNAPSAEELVDEYLARGDRWDLRERALELEAVPVLLVAGADDAVAPEGLHHHPLVEALKAAGHPRLRSLVLDDDHGFSRHRLALVEILHAWLEDQEAGR